MAEKPTIPEIRQILGQLQVPSEEYSEIQPGLIMGAITSAKDTALLTKLGVTHIVNCAYDPTGKGNFIYVDTNEEYYTKRDFNCKYLGVRAMDTARFNICKFFDDAANFIDDAVNTNGIVYIHCYMGMSRCAALVLAYLMIKKNMTLKEAVTLVRNKREIHPNDGFLQQLLDLEERLQTK